MSLPTYLYLHMFDTHRSGYGQTNMLLSGLDAYPYATCLLQCTSMIQPMFNIHSLLPITLLISNTITAKSDHAVSFMRKLHKDTLSKLDIK